MWDKKIPPVDLKIEYKIIKIIENLLYGYYNTGLTEKARFYTNNFASFPNIIFDISPLKAYNLV